MSNWKSIFIIIATVIAAACSKESIHGDGFHHTTNREAQAIPRSETAETRNVMLLYSAGFNSLSSWLTSDIADLQDGWIPTGHRNDNILLIYSHLTKKSGNYSTPNAPILTRVYKDLNGQVIKDTIAVYPDETHSATAEQIHAVLSLVKETYPAKSYGMIFSSHSTGYLPAGYYTKPDSYIYKEKSGQMYKIGRYRYATQPIPYYAPEHDPSLPAVKSIGQDQVGSFGNYMSYEIELGDFAEAIPMPLEYILFDTCLTGGVEVAYELRDKCKYLGFSQTEVLAEGYNYKTLTQHLIGSKTADIQSVCEDYFDQYINDTGINRSATISMIDCSKMEPLAQICKELFEKYRTEIGNLDPYTVQRYYRSSFHWFYDLKDILIKAGASEQDIETLQSTLDKCVIYKAATPTFMYEFDINIHSGFSMYLPCHGSRELDKYYRTLSWNKATSLVL